MDSSTRVLIQKWAIVLASGLFVFLLPVPSGITRQSWGLLAIFIATIVGTILRPVPSGAMVLLGITAVILARVMPVDPARIGTGSIETARIKQALGGYADPVVWLVLAAFFISRGMIKTGLGRRIAYLFIRTIGHKSLGLGYALVGTDVLLATFIPSNGARSGGIIFPIAKSIAEAYDSRPGPTAARLGAFLMAFLYQCEVIICAMFLTGQAGNLLIQRFAFQASGIDMSYTRWMAGGIVPGLVALAIVPVILYRIFPPEVRSTPRASEIAQAELDAHGADEAAGEGNAARLRACGFVVDDYQTAWNRLCRSCDVRRLRSSSERCHRLGRYTRRARCLGRLHLVWRDGAAR